MFTCFLNKIYEIIITRRYVFKSGGSAKEAARKEDEGGKREIYKE